VIFDGVISSYSERFTLFLPDGTPVRAVVDLTLSESRDGAYLARQNPTSGGVGGDRVWVVREGDTLPWIAFSEYRDATEWRSIADANRLTNVRHLIPGTVLVIPSA
jgi:nucleoid-associated protein YgaU